MIYLNYAATSYPKPECVIKAYNESINALPSAQFRSAGIFDNSDLFDETRKLLGTLLGISEYNNIYFASGSTDGLNRLIGGLGFDADEYITTATEHNSVLRPLFNLTQNKEPVIVPCDSEGLVNPDILESMIEEKCRVLILNHSSNVTGAVQDAKAFGEIARKHNLLYILDVSQSAGCIPIYADEWGVEALAFTGHKSIMGVQGTGGYYIRPSVNLKPLLYGGTGKDSTKIKYDSDYEYEVGTQNSSGIAALNAALKFVLDKGVDSIHFAENEKMAYLINGLKAIDGLTLYGGELIDRGPVLSLEIAGLIPADAAYILQSGYGIITRAGLQCAPLIHGCMGTAENGTLRVSISDETKTEEIDALINALREISAAIE